LINQIEMRLSQLGILLPEAFAPVADYRSFTRSGDLVYIAGQVSKGTNGGVHGILGLDIDLVEAAGAARLCGLNLLAQMKVACDGDLGRVAQSVKLNVFVQAGPDIEGLPAVADGCSSLLAEVFGEKGRPARTTVGVYRLPSNHAVEADAVFETR
jgi:enamine deaminase RidA (YjgF/YER057c/UK114 family)